MDERLQANVGGWLRDHAAQRPERIAVEVDGGEALSYAALNALANRAAHALSDLGVTRGERVALALGSEPLYLALYFAAAKLGAILLPLNTRLTAHELGFQLEDADVRVLIHEDDTDLHARTGTQALTRDALLSGLPADESEPALAPGGEEPQVLMYTSGTTGTPKGALLPHRKTVANTKNAQLYFDLREDDVVVAPVPLFHSYGLKILSVPTLFAGARLVLVPRFDAGGLQETVRRQAGTLLGAVPVMYRRMLAHGLAPGAFASLRRAFCAGAPLDVATVEAFARAGVALCQGYGQTETSILCCLDARDALRKAGSVGRPVGHCELRIADERGVSAKSGEPGEILVRGEVVMTGYWRRPEETAASRLDGWHRTGDLAVQDDEGYVTLVGRRKEMYISGGENVYPAEVEHVLRDHPDVSDVAVLGVPDPDWGETGRAYVVPHAEHFDDFNRGALLAFARERLAGYKCPREIRLVAELPHTPSGKIQKHLLGP